MAPSRRTQSISFYSIWALLLVTQTCNCNSRNDKLSQQTKPTNNNQHQDAPVDDLLKDMLDSLDMLDQKVSQMTNKTPNALMRENLNSMIVTSTNVQARKLDQEQSAGETKSKFKELNASASDETLVKIAESFSLDRRNSADDTLASAASEDSPQMSSPDDNIHSRRSNARHIARQQSGLQDDAFREINLGEFSEGHLQFTLDLMQATFAGHGYSSKTNVIESFMISPLSIQLILMLMHLGARGQTRLELANCLHLHMSPTESNRTLLSSDRMKQLIRPTTRKSGVQLPNPSRKSSADPHELFGSTLKNLLKDPGVSRAFTSSNQLFIQKNLPLSTQYEHEVMRYYNADLKSVDFQNQIVAGSSSHGNPNSTSASSPDGMDQSDVQKLINDWVEQQTRGKISNFVSSPIPTSTLMMAINAIYFKGDWQYKFDPSDTESEASFTRADGKIAKVPMMVNMLPLAFAHDAALQASIVELPYKAQRLGLFLVLPDETAGVFDIIQKLNSTSFANLIASMRKPGPNTSDRSGPKGVNVRIPRFSVESSPRISQILTQQLSLKTLFSPDLADFSGIFSQKHNLNSTNGYKAGLDELIHKAMLQVDEHGSVAAASSATIVERFGLFNGTYFEADHPFLIFLMDKQSGLVLFSGVYAGPQ